MSINPLANTSIPLPIVGAILTSTASILAEPALHESNSLLTESTPLKITRFVSDGAVGFFAASLTDPQNRSKEDFGKLATAVAASFIVHNIVDLKDSRVKKREQIKLFAQICSEDIDPTSIQRKMREHSHESWQKIFEENFKDQNIFEILKTLHPVAIQDFIQCEPDESSFFGDKFKELAMDDSSLFFSSWDMQLIQKLGAAHLYEDSILNKVDALVKKWKDQKDNSSSSEDYHFQLKELIK